MSTDYGNNQGGVGALASGTSSNVQQAGLPIGYNKLPLTQAAAQRSAATSLRTRRLAAAAGSVQVASNQATLRVNGATVAASDVTRFSGGDLFIASTGGVLAGAEPALAAVGSVQGAITDGAAKWQPLGERTRAPWADTEVVTITDNAGSSPLTQYNAYENPGLFEMGSHRDFFYVSLSGGNTRWRSYLLFDGSTADNGLGANGLLGAYTTRVFATQSDVIDIGYFSNNAGALNERWLVWVNDKLVTEGTIVPAASGGARYVRLVIGGGRRKRRIRIAHPGNFTQTHIGIPSDCVLELPVDPGWVNLDCMDSFASTEMASIPSIHHDFATASAMRLGFEHNAFASIGGTSYLRANGARRGLKALVQAGEFAEATFNSIRYGHGYNAAGNGDSPEAEAAGGLYCWKYFQDRQPEAYHIIHAPWYARPGFEAAMTTQANRLRAAFEQWGNPRSAFIDPMTGMILLGDGTQLRPSGTPWIPTNAASWMLPPAGGDFDGAHISAAARSNFTDLEVDAVDTILQAFGT